MFAADFSRFSSYSFEKLIRLICFQKFGSAGQVFSKGADGGRDFCFDGDIPGYETRSWSGYLVVQAKFKDNATKSPLQWVISQLREERSKYESGDLGYKRPDYYILATNVQLSGASSAKKVGGFERVTAELQQWQTGGLIRGFDIWSGDKIDDFLLLNAEIRRAFAAWAPGDALTAMMERLFAEEHAFAKTVIRSLVRQLKRDKFVRLQDAGNVGDPQIRAGQVFIDLPITESLNDEKNTTKRFVDFLVKQATDKLNPGFNQQDQQQGHSRIARRIVFLGGPGQGKSTASLFTTQLFRCALLSEYPNIDGETSAIIEEVKNRAEREGISTSIPRRFPVHLSLPHFADLISKAREAGDPEPSILSHICATISAMGDERIERLQIRRLLHEYPWIIMLDGFDEVPASGERDALLQAIADFEDEIHEADADVLMTLTSRPQGYNQALNVQRWQHYWLVDLPAEQALAYAGDLAMAQYPEDSLRRENILGLLTDASIKPATARLMVSPLQITIMHTIADTGGSVPAARWELFNDYFEVLKKREKAKGGLLKKIIEKHANHIGPIHQRVGLLLQVESERKGQAGASLSHERFQRLLEKYLQDEGYTGDELVTRVKELYDVALQRFVLLSTREEGYITFDVRSLQEYMAASALTTGPSDLLTKRLSAIVGNAHWRHVFLIAASRCFSDDAFHYQRDVICHVARHLETNTPDLIAGNGALLALDLFSDGIGLDNPVARRILAKHALELLQFGPFELDTRLKGILEQETIEIVEDRLRACEESEDIASQAAWKLRLWLSGKGRCAKTVAEPLLPSDERKAISLINSLEFPLPKALVAAIGHLIHALGPKKSEKDLWSFLINFHEWQADPEEETSASSRTHTDDRNVVTIGGKVDALPFSLHDFLMLANLGNSHRTQLGIFSHSQGGDFSILINSIQNVKHLAAFDEAALSTKWCGLYAGAQFLKRPGKLSLRDALLTLTGKLDEAKEAVNLLPWPLAALIFMAESDDQLQTFAYMAAAGRFGNKRDWAKAEERWSKQGLRAEDFEALDSTTWYTEEIAKQGCPFICAWSSSHSATAMEVVNQLASIAARVENQKVATHLSKGVVFGSRCYAREQSSIPEESYLDFIRCLEISKYEWPCTHFAFAFDANVWKNEELTRRLSTCLEYCGFTRSTRDPSVSKLAAMIEAFEKAPSNVGLLPSIAHGLLNKNLDEKELVQKLSLPNLRRVAAGYVGAASMTIQLLRQDLPQRDFAYFVDNLANGDELLVLDDVANKGISNTTLIELLCLGVRATRNCVFVQNMPVALLRTTLEKRNSQLVNPKCWDGLDLPRQVYEMIF